MSDDPLTFSVPEAAKRLGIGKSKAWQLVKRGDLGVVRIDGRTIVPRIEIDRYLSAGLSHGKTAA